MERRLILGRNNKVDKKEIREGVKDIEVIGEKK
jgi:hypothetical protein